MAYRLDPTAPTPVELRRVVSHQLGHAVELLRAEGGPDADAVHDARKNLKKARSAVRLARGDFGKGVARHANAVIRDCGRALSEQRDADAMVETADRLRDPSEAAGRSTVAAVDALHTTLAQRADAARSAGGASGPSVIGVAIEIDRLDRWLALVPPRAEGWDALAPGARRQYRQGAEALAGLGDAPSDEQLHEWRKRTKDLWYHLRLLRDVWPAALKPQVKAASHLADLLGNDHDLAVLGGLLVGSTPAAGGVDLPDDQLVLIRQLVAAERACLQAEARQLGALLYAEAPDAWVDRLGSWWRTAAIASAAADVAIDKHGTAAGPPAA